MKKNIYFFFICLAVFLDAQTTINEDFNNVNGGLPTGWEAVFDEGLNYDTNYSYGIYYDFQSNPDDRSLKFSAFDVSGVSPDDSGWVLTPALSVEADEDYEYFFYVKLPVGQRVRFVFANGVANETFLMTNLLEDYSSYFTNDTNEDWVKVQGNFNPDTTGELYFGFKGFYPDYENYEYQTLVIDEVLIRKVPDCIPPSNVAVGTIGYDSADFTWEYDATDVFNVKVIEKNADIETATPVYEQTVTGQSITAINLNPATDYDFYVQSDCASDGTSDWSDKVTFTTICSPDNVMFFEDFSYSDNIGVDGAIPLCWSKIEDPTPNVDQEAYNTVTTLLGHVQLGQWVKDNEKTMFISPRLSTLYPNTNYRLRFKVFNESCANPMTGVDFYDELRYFEVGTMTDPTDPSTYTLFKTLTVPVFGEISINFDTYTGDDKYVVFNRIPNSERVYDLSLDDIYWEEIPATQSIPECVSGLSYPDGGKLISPENVHLLWTPVVEATDYKIKIGTTEGADDTLSETTVSDFSYELTSDLAYDTTYYVSIVSVNSMGESQGCSMYQFTTYKNPHYGGGDEDTIYGGYYFANSTEGAQPSSIDVIYDWIDPIGNNHTLIGNDDWVSTESDSQFNRSKSYFPISDMSFDFPFYGNNYGSGKVYINHNGAIFFRDEPIDLENEYQVNNVNSYGGGSSSGYNYTNMIGAFFTDFKFEDTQVYYHMANDMCVITWYNAANNNWPPTQTEEYATAQVILYSSGDIKVQINAELSTFDDMPPIPPTSGFISHSDIVIANSDASKVVGYKIQDAFGWLLNRDTNPESSLAIYFTPNSDNMAVNNDEAIKEANIAIYPNPTQGVLRVNTDSVVKQIQVYGMNGQKIRSVENINQLDMSSLSKGIYIVNVVTEKESKSFKVIKK